MDDFEVCFAELNELPEINNIIQYPSGHIRRKPYPSASGGTRCCSRERRFVLEQITNRTALGARDDRFSALLDRVPTALRR